MTDYPLVVTPRTGYRLEPSNVGQSPVADESR